MANIIRAGRNALTKFAPRAIHGASKAVALIAGDDAARRAEVAGAFATVLATVGAFMSGRRAKRVLEEMERTPALSFEPLLEHFRAMPEGQRDLAEAEARRMIADLGDAIAPEAVIPMLKAIAAWREDGLMREACVNACRLLRDLDRAEIDQLRTLIDAALTQRNDAVLHFDARNEAHERARLLRRLAECELSDGVTLTRRRAELLRQLLL